MPLNQLVLKSVQATECGQSFTSGHSKPCLMVCRDEAGVEYEVIVKFNNTVHGGKAGLICEALASLFAQDLNLYVPRPFIVTFPPELHSAELTPEQARNIQESSGPNFGTLRLPSQYIVFPSGNKIPFKLYDAAIQVLAFDFLIRNEDRHKEKPNCLISDNSICVIDHELAFPEARREFRPKPWDPGGAEFLHHHVFFNNLKGELPDFSGIRKTLIELPKTRFAEYITLLPTEWAVTSEAQGVVRHLEDVRENCDKYLQTLSHLLR